MIMYLYNICEKILWDLYGDFRYDETSKPKNGKHLMRHLIWVIITSYSYNEDGKLEN